MRKIKIKFMNGLDFETGINDVLMGLRDDYIFEDSDSPDFIVFTPFGPEIPQKSKAVRIGYFSENIVPDMSICDWGFGIPYEEEINHPRYMRIRWHGFDPTSLVKNAFDVQAAMQEKTRFCNFLYSHPVPYRERFFRELSKYKAVDAPGNSMNNMPSIDPLHQPARYRWEIKRRFLRQYKFTIAFENYSYPGYNTEKLLDPMLSNSVPIYFGNPMIDRHFNPKSFVNGHEYVKSSTDWLVSLLQSRCQMQAGTPHRYDMVGRCRSKLRTAGRSIKMHFQCADFADLVKRIVEIDQDDSLYAEYLKEPWFYNNEVPSSREVLVRWREIFDSRA